VSSPFHLKIKLLISNSTTGNGRVNGIYTLLALSNNMYSVRVAAVHSQFTQSERNLAAVNFLNPLSGMITFDELITLFTFHSNLSAHDRIAHLVTGVDHR
jgi:hypothetical protein